MFNGALLVDESAGTPLTSRTPDTPSGQSDDAGRKPKVVAIIVNYNSGGFLKKCVESLLAGSIRPVVHVVDNASTDDSIALARNVLDSDDVHYQINRNNVGFAAANNQLLNHEDAEYFLLLNPDCIVEPGAVQEFLSRLDNDPAIGIAGGALSNPDGTVQSTSKRKLPTPWSSLARTMGLHKIASVDGALSDFDLAGNHGDSPEVEMVEAISGAMMFVRASALPRVGLLDEGYFMHCEDLDWCKRFRDAGYKVAYVAGAKAVHFKGGSGRGPRVVWHLHRGMIRFYKKHYRRRYSLLFSVLVYSAVYARCTVLMTTSILARRKP